jgi:hypothetical protein
MKELITMEWFIGHGITINQLKTNDSFGLFQSVIPNSRKTIKMQIQYKYKYKYQMQKSELRRIQENG